MHLSVWQLIVEFGTILRSRRHSFDLFGFLKCRCSVESNSVESYLLSLGVALALGRLILVLGAGGPSRAVEAGKVVEKVELSCQQEEERIQPEKQKSSQQRSKELTG
jgi:hypothetical protein